MLTSDISAAMVSAALAHGLPAIRQAADALLLADNSVDAVLLAYGSHHIALEDRPRAVAEAVRVVRPGGKVILHDFDPASPMALFFRTVVDPHAPGGHDYPHYTRRQLQALFRSQPVVLSLHDVYDPLVLPGTSPDRAKAAMLSYLANSYGLAPYFATLGPTAGWDLLATAFDHTCFCAELATCPTAAPRPVVRSSGKRFLVEVPRVATVAVAEKRAA
ncbi:class I SAM-dependent methyltransferase [Streptomyces sp. NPDC090442]|uniref:class I SAM-dependent methyltransferase n=1 Tax=Streptomyces sp. NPDC090442 TaxID=3365962 RepID=UPI0037F8B44F